MPIINNVSMALETCYQLYAHTDIANERQNYKLVCNVLWSLFYYETGTPTNDSSCYGTPTSVTVPPHVITIIT